MGRPQRHVYLSWAIREIRISCPSVVFCEQEPFALSAAQWGLAAARLRVPFGLQMAENLDRRLPFVARAIRSTVLPRAAFVAARSDAAARLARKWGARGAVALVPHHVPGWPVQDMRNSSRFTVGFAGRLVPEKGLDTLIAAVRRLAAPVELLVVGEGPLRDTLLNCDLGHATLRILRGNAHDEMAKAYGQMDVLVLPSRTTPTWVEQFGRVLAEALWCGTPVIGSDSGEIPWVVNITEGGLVFPEGDAEALADRLSRLRQDRELRFRLAARGRVRTAELFGVSSVATALERLLMTAVERWQWRMQ